MEFRIAEYLQGDDEGNKFVIEKGTPYKTGFFRIPQTAWEVMLDDKGSPLKYKTMDDAVITIKQLQRQLPIYHYIK